MARRTDRRRIRCGAAPEFNSWVVSLWAPVVLLPLVGLLMLAASIVAPGRSDRAPGASAADQG